MTPKKSAIAYQTKSQYAYRTIREWIISRKYPPGSPLVITSLASSLGISETPVRDAIKMLISEGFVDYSDHVGAKVASPSLDELKDMFEVMLSLQATATRLAAHRVNEEMLAELGEILDKTKLFFRENRNEEYGVLNDQFHDVIESRCGNEELVAVIKAYREKTSWVRSLFVLEPKRLRESFDEHAKIYQAIQAGRCREAEKMVTEHILVSFNAYLAFMEKEKGFEEHRYLIRRDLWV